MQELTSHILCCKKILKKILFTLSNINPYEQIPKNSN